MTEDMKAPTGIHINRKQSFYLQNILEIDPDAQLFGWYRGKPLFWAYGSALAANRRLSDSKRQVWMVNKEGEPCDLPKTWEDQAVEHLILLDHSDRRIIQDCMSWMITS